MDIEEILNSLGEKITSFLDRIEINDIIGISTQFDQTPLTKDDVLKYLDENVDKRVQVKNAIMLNDINFYSADADETDADKRPTNESEHVHLEKQKDELLMFFEATVSKACRKGENAYPMNSVFKTIIRMIDRKSSELNFERWFAKTPRTKNNGYYIILNHERFYFHEYQVDFVGNCANMIRYELELRQDLLQQLKNNLVNMFSEHLFLPDHEFLPKIKFNGDKVDINELIFALFSSGRLENPEHTKAILLNMFEIPKDTFSKDVNYVLNKKKGSFLQDLINMLDKLKLGSRSK